MKIRTKIFSSFLVVLLIFLAGVIFVFSEARRLEQNDRYLSSIRRETTALLGYRSTVSHVVEQTYKVGFLDENIATLDGAVAAQQQAFQKLVSAIEGRATDIEVKEISNLHEFAMQMTNELTSTAKELQKQKYYVKARLIEVIKSRFGKTFMTRMQRILDGRARELEVMRNQVRSRIGTLMGRLGLLFVTALVVVLLLESVLSHSITKRLNVIQNAAARIEAGDLNFSIPVEGRDELSSLSISFNRMLKELSSSVEQIHAQQSTLVHSSKMSALGQMAGGLAHEINNPLAIIFGKVAQLRRKMEVGNLPVETLTGELIKVQDTVDRIARIVAGMRAFSRSGDRDPFERRDLSQIVEDTLVLCQERFRNHGIQLEVGHVSQIEVYCRPVQLSQVLLNLLNNAADAIDELPTKWIRVEAGEEGNHIILSITDSGSGIPAEISQRLMEPFFTTKPSGKGTGLGLSISKKIMEEHGGKLQLDSFSKNTKFVIIIPKLQRKTALAA